MKKCYIMLTYDIHPIGGAQMCCSAKAECLEKMGYRVFILFNGKKTNDCKISNLNSYVKGGNLFFAIQPGFLSKTMREDVVAFVKRLIGNPLEYEEIYIESHYDIAALWGEYLAKMFHGKHIVLLVNEKYRGISKHYEEHLDFFYEKYLSQSMFGSATSLKLLFDGYCDIPLEKKYPVYITEGNPVQEVENKTIDNMKAADFRIAYIGRFKKEYVDSIIDGVIEFAQKYSDRSIVFILVGDVDEDIEKKKRMLNKIDKANEVAQIELFFAGDLVPIPKKLYRQLDCVIAGTGCADISAKYCPTIVIDKCNYRSNGVLGYTCFDSHHKHGEDEQQEISETLESVLVNNCLDGIEYSDDFSSVAREPTQVISESLKLFEIIGKDKYYDVLESDNYIFQREKRLYMYKEIFKMWLNNSLLGKKIELFLASKSIKNIAIYGVGDIGTFFFNEVKKNNMNVTYIIDSCQETKECELSGKLHISPKEVGAIEDTDAIIVTPSHAFEKIERMLRNEGVCIPILDLSDILYEMENGDNYDTI